MDFVYLLDGILIKCIFFVKVLSIFASDFKTKQKRLPSADFKIA